MKISSQTFSPDRRQVHLAVRPDARTTALCHQCGTACPSVHSWTARPVRDLDLAATRVTLDCALRKVFCPTCGRILIEQCEAAHPYRRVTPRLARYVYALCKKMSLADVAAHVGLDWKTVRAIDKAFLEEEFGATDYGGLQILAVDEIAIRKGHHYLTVVLDYESGRVVWMGEDRKQATLEAFFDAMSQKQRDGIRAVAMDMWDPFIAAVRAKVPNARIVFDLFHVVKAFGKVIDAVRIDQARQAAAADKSVYKGSKFLLLKNRANLERDEHTHLRALLKLNAVLCTVLILRDQLKKIWEYRSRYWAGRALDRWCALARGLGLRVLDGFCRMLERHREGILSHCRWPIHTGKLEGVNNKIKFIKRRAYGYHDIRYFELKVIQAFAPEHLN
jgi:transposase